MAGGFVTTLSSLLMPNSTRGRIPMAPFQPSLPNMAVPWKRRKHTSEAAREATLGGRPRGGGITGRRRHRGHGVHVPEGFGPQNILEKHRLRSRRDHRVASG